MVKEERMRLGSGSASILQGGKAGELRLHAGWWYFIHARHSLCTPSHTSYTLHAQALGSRVWSMSRFYSPRAAPLPACCQCVFVQRSVRWQSRALLALHKCPVKLSCAGHSGDVLQLVCLWNEPKHRLLTRHHFQRKHLSWSKEQVTQELWDLSDFFLRMFLKQHQRNYLYRT